jgi:type II secretory pathway pseudopilin PulG
MRAGDLRLRSPSQEGFTYLMLLWWVAIGGVMLAAVAQSWVNEARREKDIELAFRAAQITRAIQSYYEATPGGVRLPPTSFKDLLEDRRGPVLMRHLRQVWPDPVTGGAEWGLIKRGPYLQGVYSLSRLKPVRGPDGARSYRDWRFTAAVSPPAPASAASGAFGSMNVMQPDLL